MHSRTTRRPGLTACVLRSAAHSHTPLNIAMGFENLNTEAGVAVLDGYMLDKSFVEGFELSQADVAVFTAVATEPSSAKYPHAARWFRHVAAHQASHAMLPGEKKAASEYGPSGKQAAAAAADDDEDVDLFGESSSEDEETKRGKAERLAAYHAKKATKPVVIAKSSIVLDVKPWDDETDLAAMEAGVRAVSLEGMIWGASKLVPIGYGIKKLQISCVVEDDKVGLDMINDAITELEDLVQSVDVVSFNKV